MKDDNNRIIEEDKPTKENSTVIFADKTYIIKNMTFEEWEENIKETTKKETIYNAKGLIAKEIRIAQQYGEKTSRLTSLFVQLDNL